MEVGMMSRGAWRALAFVGAAALGPLWAGAGEAQVKVPADFAFEQQKDSPGVVTFGHEKHKAAGVDKCPACHTKVFKMKKGQTGPLAMEKMKAGEQCGTCHNGKTKVADKVVFTVDDQASCGRCHKKT
jgi:c(7)-type cytochrome triheme protein